MTLPRVLIPENPVGIDRFCGVVQEKLGSIYPWLNHLFGKSQILVNKKNKEYKYPAIHYKNGTYLDMLPDKCYGNFCFFIIDDPQKVIDFIPHQLSKIETDFSIVFWMNLKSIYPLSQYRELEQVKIDILRTLNTKMKFQQGRLAITSIAERFDKVYSEYSIREVNQQVLMHPYAALRFNGTMTINEVCV